MKTQHISLMNKFIIFLLDSSNNHMRKRIITKLVKVPFLRQGYKYLCSSILRSPLVVMLSVTNACQCKCVHCGVSYQKSDRARELGKNEIFNLIDELHRMNTRILYFFGGEPLMRDDLPELIRYASEKNIQTELDTNGYLLTPEKVKELKTAGLNLIRVSIDSPIPEEHNQLRRCNNIYEKAVAGIQHCVREGIECHISTYVSKEKLYNGKLDGIAAMADTMKVKLRLLRPLLSGNLLNSYESLFNQKDKRKLYSYLKPGEVYMEMKNFDTRDTLFYCNALTNAYIYISSTGDIQPCCYFPVVFGNIREKPVKSIMRKMRMHEMFKKLMTGCPMNNIHFRKKYLEN